MAEMTENINWLSDGREPRSGSTLYILFNFYKKWHGNVCALFYRESSFFEL